MKRLLAIVLALMMVLSLAACGNSSGGTPANDNANNGTNQGSTQQDNSVVEQQAAQSDFVAEKIVYQTEDPVSLVPFGGSKGEGPGALMHSIYQTLGNRDKFGGEFKGILMEKWTEIDPRTYEVKLYENIYDTNHNQIDANDVKFSIDSYKAQGEMSDVNDIEGIEVIDQFTFRMILAAEEPALGTFELMCSYLNIVDEDSYKASPDGMATTPVGSGPYKLEHFDTGAKAITVINEDYWEPEEIRDLPVEMQNVKSVEYQVLSESSAISMALQAKTVDFSNAVNSMDLPGFQTGGAYSNGIGVYTRPRNNANVLCFNAAEESPLHDENLRKAIMYAIDASFISQAANGGNTEQCCVLGGPNYPDYQEKWWDYYPQPDMDKAKQYLAQSGYPNGVELNLLFISGNSSIEDAAVILQSQLLPLNIKLNINGEVIGQYLADEHDPAGWDFTVCNFSGSDYITNVWRKYFDNTSTGNGMTKNFVSDNQLQSLIEACTSETGHTPENIDAAWAYIMQNYWMYPMFVPNDNFVYNSNLISAFGFDCDGTVIPGGCTYVQS